MDISEDKAKKANTLMARINHVSDGGSIEWHIGQVARSSEEASY